MRRWLEWQTEKKARDIERKWRSVLLLLKKQSVNTKLFEGFRFLLNENVRHTSEDITELAQTVAVIIIYTWFLQYSA